MNLLIDESTLDKFVADFATKMPFEISDSWIEANHCIGLSLRLDGKKVKLKIVPEISSGKLSFRIDRAFLVGININVAPLLAKLEGVVNANIPPALQDFIKMDNKSIIINIPAKYAGITAKAEILIGF
jgi:hypothetical protein